MPFRFRKSIKIGGVRFNFGKTGFNSISTKLGPVTLNNGKRGFRQTIGVRGTGLSYTNIIGSQKSPHNNPNSKIAYSFAAPPPINDLGGNQPVSSNPIVPNTPPDQPPVIEDPEQNKKGISPVGILVAAVVGIILICGTILLAIGVTGGGNSTPTPDINVAAIYTQAYQTALAGIKINNTATEIPSPFISPTILASQTPFQNIVPTVEPIIFPSSFPTATNVYVAPIQNQPASNPSGVTAICQDGTYSYSQHASGTCSRHGGVKKWINHP